MPSRSRPGQRAGDEDQRRDEQADDAPGHPEVEHEQEDDAGDEGRDAAEQRQPVDAAVVALGAQHVGAPVGQLHRRHEQRRDQPQLARVRRVEGLHGRVAEDPGQGAEQDREVERDDEPQAHQRGAVAAAPARVVRHGERRAGRDQRHGELRQHLHEREQAAGLVAQRARDDDRRDVADAECADARQEDEQRIAMQRRLRFVNRRHAAAPPRPDPRRERAPACRAGAAAPVGRRPRA